MYFDKLFEFFFSFNIIAILSIFFYYQFRYYDDVYQFYFPYFPFYFYVFNSFDELDFFFTFFNSFNPHVK